MVQFGSYGKEMKLYELEPVFVYYMPETFEYGKLYVSKEFGLAIHLCACGSCGRKTVTDLDFFWKDGWKYEEKDGKVSLSPSIGNWQMPCKSHYFIKENKIEWC